MTRRPSRQLRSLRATAFTDPTHRVKALWVLAMLGYGIRIAIWLLSDGSNDIRTWRTFAEIIRDLGLAETYRSQTLFNHPPLMGWWSVVALDIADRRVLTFAQVFKIPSLVAEVITGFLLLTEWTKRGGLSQARQALAVYGLSISCILISAFHGNTDAIYFCLTFASAYLLERGRPLTAGSTLAAAMNVKLIPALLIFPLASRCARWADVRRFLAGSALGVLPFVVAVITFDGEQRSHFVDNVFRYQSNRENWGVELAVRLGYGLTRSFSATLADALQRSGDWYAVHGAAVLFVGSCVFACWHAWWIRGHRGRPFDAYQLAALTFGGFLLLGSGFGVQYVGCIVAPLLAWSIWDGLLVSSMTGLFIGALYARFMVRWLPMASQHEPIPRSFIGFSIIVWITVAAVCVRLGKGVRHARIRGRPV